MNNRLSFGQVLFGTDCLLCGAAINQDINPDTDLDTHPASNLGRADFCLPCRKSLPHLASAHCSVCAVPVTGSSICGACLAEPPAFGRCIAAFKYAFPIDALLQSLKYRSNLAMARVLADLLAMRIISTLGTALPDYIVPMPLHAARMRERGFNQALEIARRVSKNIRVPLLPGACERIRDTPSQTQLPWKAREKNVRGAFACDANLSGKRIAMLDDVLTTGASLNELAKLLRSRGATQVSAWVLARTLPDALSASRSASP